MSYSIARLTSFAIISALEDDLRNFIEVQFLPNSTLKKVISDAVYKKVIQRSEKDNPSESSHCTESDLLSYIDFGDSLEIIAANARSLTGEQQGGFKKVYPLIVALIPIRNRVMHSRPLMPGDFPCVVDTCSEMQRKWPGNFPRLSECIAKLKRNPEFVLSLEIPDYRSRETISHNLPIPDFDETGFIGRKDCADAIRKHIYGAYPVISIIGIGGIGKTALALKVAYSLLDDDQCPFDAIVWTTSKTTTLGRSELIKIEDAITSSLGVVQSISDSLGASRRDDFSEIIEYMSTFKVLLILDNLETVLDTRIRDFLSQIPVGSKVLITSRVSLGGYDYPYALQPLDAKEAVRLLRELSRARSLDILFKAKPETLDGYVKRMRNNPGFIKWFVAAVNAGERPDKLLVEPKLFLDFCMRNVFEHLSPAARQILDTMVASGTLHSFSMLHYLTAMEPVELEKAMLELLSSNMVNMQNVNGCVVYKISDIPSLYVKNFHAPSRELVEEVQRLRRQIVAQTEDLESAHITHPYNFNNIAVTDKAYRIVAKYLHDSLRALKGERYGEADEWIQKAKAIEPNYFEVHRVEAMLFAQKGDLISAKSSYQLAVEINPDSAPLRLWYGGFLTRYCDEHSSAIDQFAVGRELDQGSGHIFDLNEARAWLYLRDFNQTEKIIESLENGGQIGERNKMILSSLKIQFFARKGEFLVDQREYRRAIETFRRLLIYFESLPEAFKDSRNVKQLSTSYPALAKAASILYRSEEMPDDVALVLDAFEHVELKSRVRKTLASEGMQIGTVLRIAPGKSFGFIKAETGAEYFFHRQEMLVSDDFEKIVPYQTRVRFTIGLNEKGPCAVKVVVAETLDS